MKLSANVAAGLTEPREVRAINGLGPGASAGARKRAEARELRRVRNEKQTRAADALLQAVEYLEKYCRSDKASDIATNGRDALRALGVKL